ncbi:Protein zds1 [Hypsizygus marmoreus]|uniref:Protein zds1 n=1 Tax=Hypsizygus marmoreus TaxID=39966 RepID=A0A369JPW6_HYPMA|nr:Protein zds1 [Hypsizygus marmoreus]
MATRTLQPSEYEIQREVEALRDIRRRSTTPGALTIDPDLPNQSPPSSPTAYRLGSPSGSTYAGEHEGSLGFDESSLEGSSSGTSGSSGESASVPNNPADDPFHLFWVPASLHPEIAPAEFRAFLKEHARSPPPSDDGSSTASRSGSISSLSPSSSLGRKKSMLSRQYRPAEHDGVENEHIVPLRRNRSSVYANQMPQLTINDLQRLEELAEESDDPSRLRNVLRRSMSLNISPSAIGQMDEMPEMGDEADAPIIVPPPGQILRRTARTKIRKPGLPGDGGGHRFGSSRRGTLARTPTTPVEPRTSSDISSSDHGESAESSTANRRRTFSDDGSNQRPDSFSEEASIFDAYARDEEEEEAPSPLIIKSPPPPPVLELPPLPPTPTPPPPPPPPEIQPSLLEALGPVIQQPQPQHLLSPQPSVDQQGPSRTPSPIELSPLPAVERPPLPHSPPSFLSTTPSPPSQHRKEKDKKSLFKWGGDKGGKKHAKDRETRERAEKEKEKEKEKDSSFFGSLFGGSKKKQDENPPPLLLPGGTTGRETAQALLGASKSKSLVSPASPALSAGVGVNNYSRYPIHVERAIYRLSHIKLANPRRPLYEQVLISNLMFWYLGVINKAQNPQPSPNEQPAGAQAPAGATDSSRADELEVEKERKERELQEQRERAEKERLEKERLEREQREREIEMKKKESGRRGSLTKTPTPGSPGGVRRAEMPVKGPQYEMQHRVMEQEYSGYSGQQGIPMGRAASAPVGSGNGIQYSRSPQSQASQFNTPPKLVQPQPQQPGDQFYYTPEPMQSQQTRLPPGAMPPDQAAWQQSHVSRQQSPSSSRSRSPPSQQNINAQPPNAGRYNLNSSQDNLVLGGGGGERIPGRSLSATAVSPSPPMTNGKVRKGQSAHAVAPAHGRQPRISEGQHEQNGTGEEEDMPLAMWQQQRRR